MRAAARRAARHLAQMGYDPAEEELAALWRQTRDLFGTWHDFDAAVARAGEAVSHFRANPTTSPDGPWPEDET